MPWFSSRSTLVLGLVLTLGLGLLMRWSLAGFYELPLPFPHLRHAHSHLGYFALLFPLAWVGWKRAGVPVPGKRILIAYGMATAVAVLGFVRGGYGPTAIVGCAAVAALWLWTALPLVARMRQLRDPLGAVPLGLVAGLGCVPPIAVHLRTQPALAQAFVAAFLAALLFLVIVPSSLAALHRAIVPWPLLLTVGGLAAAALGFGQVRLLSLALVAEACLLVASVTTVSLPLHVRGPWWLTSIGLVLLGVGLLPNVRPVALGAIHFLILSPVAVSLAGPVVSVGARAWWVNHSVALVMATALVSQAFGAGGWTWTVSASAGTGTLIWWSVALAQCSSGEAG
ncbi:MAG: hypothetical protein AAF654_02385 [Myxococcota bacterium]